METAKTGGKRDYCSEISVRIPAEEALARIGRVPKWWASDYSGDSEKLGDVFTIKFGETTVSFRIVEAIPGKKIVWLVTDCHLHWLKDKKEWKSTKIVWEIAARGDSTSVTFTHLGLVPGIECFDDCKIGWDFYIKQSLFKYLSEGKGLPDQG